MANKEIFRSIIGKIMPFTDTTNATGAPAYALSAKQTLAQVAVTGCLNNTYYASADEQLSTLLAVMRKSSASPRSTKTLRISSTWDVTTIFQLHSKVHSSSKRLVTFMRRVTHRLK